jgi:hypothetical protein
MSNRVVTATIAGLAALVLPALLTSAEASGFRNKSCVYDRGAVSCVTTWSRSGTPDPHVTATAKEPSAEETSAKEEREKLWLARCKPELKQDDYGVMRYSYAATGCEFGKYQ